MNYNENYEEEKDGYDGQDQLYKFSKKNEKELNFKSATYNYRRGTTNAEIEPLDKLG